jgi:hypothetical protein
VFGGNVPGAPAVASFVNAYLWRTGETMVHHIRAESIADVRERIAATHGDEIARRAVIKSLQTARPEKSESAAA